MDLQTLRNSAWFVSTLTKGALTRDVDKAIEQLTAEKNWDLLSHLLLTSAEVSARRIVDALVELEVVEPLVAAACLRREVRRPGIAVPTRAANARRMFHDFEADDEGASVPDHIVREAEAIAAAAQQSRQIAIQREAELDRDPIRAHIVDGLADKLSTSDAALDALIVIARVSAWEDTRRDAAMKVVNNTVATGKLHRAGRIDDIVALGKASASRAVAGKLAAALSEDMPEASDPNYRAALEFLAEHHPDAPRQRQAKQELERT